MAHFTDLLTHHRLDWRRLGTGPGYRQGGEAAKDLRTDVTRILAAIAQGDAHAAEQLLPLVNQGHGRDHRRLDLADDVDGDFELLLGHVKVGAGPQELRSEHADEDAV